MTHVVPFCSEKMRRAQVGKEVTRARRRSGLCLRASRRRAELMVDADQCGLHPTREAVEHLRKEGFRVRTTVFAAPGRVDNKKWQMFFKERGVSFSPITRSQEGEASDTAIDRKLSLVALFTRDICIGLLTSDIGFLRKVREIVSLRQAVYVFVPMRAASSIRSYQETGARVVAVAVEDVPLPGPKVRAILQSTGNGTVEMAESWSISPADDEAFEKLQIFLQDLGYRGEKGYLVQSIAKFWFANRMGRLTVYPSQAACAAVQEVMQTVRPGTSWVPCHNDLAFFLPVTSRCSSKAKQRIREYGGRLCWSVYMGGGPFMIKDSAGIVAQALRKMGYLDDEFNLDLSEAMFVFLNRADNKGIIRKNFGLPIPTDTAVDVEQKLRVAFLSHATAGTWCRNPGDGDVRATLHKHGFLKEQKAPQVDMLQAMRKFSRIRGLQQMRNYNGYVFNIQQHIHRKDPSRVGLVQFRI